MASGSDGGDLDHVTILSTAVAGALHHHRSSPVSPFPTQSGTPPAPAPVWRLSQFSGTPDSAAGVSLRDKKGGEFRLSATRSNSGDLEHINTVSATGCGRSTRRRHFKGRGPPLSPFFFFILRRVSSVSHLCFRPVGIVQCSSVCVCQYYSLVCLYDKGKNRGIKTVCPSFP